MLVRPTALHWKHEWKSKSDDCDMALPASISILFYSILLHKHLVHLQNFLQKGQLDVNPLFITYIGVFLLV